MATLPRSFTTGEHSDHSSSNGTAAAKAKVKKSKKLSWTLGRKKSRDEAFVADGSGELVLKSLRLQDLCCRMGLWLASWGWFVNSGANYITSYYQLAGKKQELNTV